METSTNDQLEKLKFLSLREVAELFGLKVDRRGMCRTLERYGDSDYCKIRGLKPLPHYFSGAKTQYDPKDVIEFRKQFKKQ